MHGNKVNIFGDDAQSTKSGQKRENSVNENPEMSKIKEESTPTQVPAQNPPELQVEDPGEEEKLVRGEEIPSSQTPQPQTFNFLKNIFGGGIPAPEKKGAAKDSKPLKKGAAKSNRRKMYYR